MNRKPELSFWQIWNMCFGFLGIQFGFALQNANVSRIFQTLGADVADIPVLWIAAPLTGLIVQPIVGHFSDRTWTRLGRRRPYFLYGAEHLRHADAQTYVVRHVPEEDPDGCGGAYDIQLSKASALLIWCKDSKTGEVTSSHTTTYHLNFVKVPKTYLLHKSAGDPTLIELSKEGGGVVVTDVR
jgi:hypothetical protein